MEQKMKLSGGAKASYGLGAVGKDMVYMLSASYILYYFQDILGVSAIAMGIILLIARVFDAFNDPLMGIVVAKTKTKWGRPARSTASMRMTWLRRSTPFWIARPESLGGPLIRRKPRHRAGAFPFIGLTP